PLMFIPFPYTTLFRSEGPGLAAVLLRPDVRGDRDLLADLPAELLGQLLAHDHAGARAGECLPLGVGHHPLRIDVAITLRIEAKQDRKSTRLNSSHQIS